MTPPVDDHLYKKPDPRAPLIEVLSLVKAGVRDTTAAVHTLGAETAAQTKDLVDTTVAAAQQTVEGVQSAAEEMGEQLTQAVGETAATVQRTFTFRAQMEQHPWRIVGGALLVGYLLGSWEKGRTYLVAPTARKRAPARPPAP